MAYIEDRIETLEQDFYTVMAKIYDLEHAVYKKADGKQTQVQQTTEEFVRVRHGKWEEIKSGDWANATEYRCSECGKYRLAVNPVNYNWNYCPNCGARMEDQDE